MKWQISFPHLLHLKQWDDETVVYDGQSGNTHLLGATAAAVVEELLASPQDADSLAQKMFLSEASQSFNDAKDKLEAIMSQLAAISLISPVAP